MNTSFEFFPPKTEKGKEKLNNLIKSLSHFSPEYFSVTFGAAGSTRKGTLETCVSVKNLGQNACPHLSGIGSSKSVIKEILNEFKGYGLTRIVALRGDLPSGVGGFGDFPLRPRLNKVYLKRNRGVSLLKLLPTLKFTLMPSQRTQTLKIF